MIIDFHTHVFPPEFIEGRDELIQLDATFANLYAHRSAKMATAETLISAMDEDEIDMAVIMGIGWSDRESARKSNEYVARMAQKYPNRLIGFVSTNPAWGDAAVTELETYIGPNIRGIGELHPDIQDFNIADQQIMAPLMSFACAHEMVVLTHASEPVGHSYPGKGHTTPEALWRFIGAFPGQSIVCAHWGGGLPFYGLMPEVAKAINCTYFDTAASILLYRPQVYSMVSNLIGSKKILFGTDYPLLSHRRVIAQLRQEPMDDDDKENILWRNANALLHGGRPI